MKPENLINIEFDSTVKNILKNKNNLQMNLSARQKVRVFTPKGSPSQKGRSTRRLNLTLEKVNTSLQSTQNPYDLDRDQEIWLLKNKVLYL